MNWTVKTNAGNIVDSDIMDINEYLKMHSNLFVLVRLDAIKTIIVYQ